uniref:Protein-serine/threonine kinase n=1 Tax=Aplanochytrium stocchinoi TaxID=215587 RepID=A0A7S3PHZ6_9STRA|mmetsp:Transcript_10900/g.13645  ORF Transcript_10900/g.13645 Transcript_10900/m.13645 type:complete len:419 (+) Transcript_10900:380-1636(+)
MSFSTTTSLTRMSRLRLRSQIGLTCTYTYRYRLLCRHRRNFGIGTSRTSATNALLADYSMKKARPGTIQQMIAMSKEKNRVHVAPELQQELLVRIAHRYRDFSELPTALKNTRPLQQIIETYYDAFRSLGILELDCESDRDFVRLISEFKAKDSTTLPRIALGIKEWQSNFQSRNQDQGRVNLELAAQLDDLFTARLSIRMLIGQFCEYDGQSRGRIKRGLVVADVAKEAAERAAAMCRDRFNVCPDIVIEGNTDFKLTYVRSHLHHILFELLKNSARAVVDQHLGATGAERRKRLRLSSKGHLGSNGLPPVHVVIAGGKEDCVVKVSDEGGGIPRSGLAKIWSYQYTTAADDDKAKTAQEQTFRDNFYGVGYGLPIARVFARYFGGELKIISTEGWGTDAYIYINRLESAALEVLPD